MASLALGVGVEASLDMEKGRGRVKMGGGSVGTPRPGRNGPGRVPGVGSPPGKVPDRVPGRVSCGSEGTGGLALEN